MCGLAGMAALGGTSLTDASDQVLAAMTRAVSHRGPDEQVTVREGPVGLGFTRLALVAPDAGDQPIWTTGRRVVLIANGEVYNHRELARGLASGAPMRTGSDCEVLPYLYEERGRDFLRDVNGMFAVVLYDVPRRRLVLARDRFGIKPLYFHRDRERIVFASEIKALFQDPRTPRSIDWRRALASPVLQSAPALTGAEPVSWFTGIEYVPPGMVIEIDLEDGRTSTFRYWEFPGSRPDLSESDEEVIEEYGRRLAVSVADCASADAELGLFLSGGVDSAAVAALAARTTTLQTFTVLNPATLNSGDAYHAHLVARRLGMPNHQVHVPHDHCPTPQEWLRFLWLMEHPMAGAEAYLKYELHRYARAVRPDLKGMLLGAASDEFNGGYSTDIAGGGGWSTFLDNLSLMVRRGEARSDVAVSAWNETLGAPVLRTVPWSTGDDDYLRYLACEYRKIHQYNVWHEDRSAAGSGIEARVPFLEHRLVELVTAIPPSRRRNLLWDKRILREAVRGLLPREVTEREKVPFVHGPGVRHTQRMLVRLLSQYGRELVAAALRSPAAREHLDADAIHAMIDGMVAGTGAESVDLLLRLVNLGLLDGMLAELPPAIVDQPAPPVPTVWAGADFETDGGLAVARQVLTRPDVPAQVVLAWAEDVFVLESVDGSGLRFLVRDGALEYVVDRSSPSWHAMVSQIDGERTLADLLAFVRARYADVAGPLEEAIDTGLLCASIGTAATAHEAPAAPEPQPMPSGAR